MFLIIYACYHFYDIVLNLVVTTCTMFGVLTILCAITLPLIVIIFRKRKQIKDEQHIYEEPSFVLQTTIQMSQNECYGDQPFFADTFITTTNPVYQSVV